MSLDGGALVVWLASFPIVMSAILKLSCKITNHNYKPNFVQLKKLMEGHLSKVYFLSILIKIRQ